MFSQMKDHSTMTPVRYNISVGIRLIIGYFMYKVCIFHILPDADQFYSYEILYGMLIASIFICRVVFCNFKNSWTATISIAFPLWIYTVLSYRYILPDLMLGLTAVMVLLSAAYAIYIFSRKIKSESKSIRQRIYISRSIKALYGTVSIVSLISILFMLCMGFRLVHLDYFMQPENKAEIIAREEVDVYKLMDENKESLVKLRPEAWADLSIQEKLDVMQTVCNIEASYLGLSEPVRVFSLNAHYTELGSYNDETRDIMINLNHLDRDPADKMLYALLHEIHHSYEHALIMAYDEVSTESKQLLLFKDAYHYATESQNYIRGFEEFSAYQAQRLEVDSNNYADLGTKRYYDWLEDVD